MKVEATIYARPTFASIARYGDEVWIRFGDGVGTYGSSGSMCVCLDDLDEDLQLRIIEAVDPADSYACRDLD